MNLVVSTVADPPGVSTGNPRELDDVVEVLAQERVGVQVGAEVAVRRSAPGLTRVTGTAVGPPRLRVHRVSAIEARVVASCIQRGSAHHAETVKADFPLGADARSRARPKRVLFATAEKTQERDQRHRSVER